jgi:hypothetical protein
VSILILIPDRSKEADAGEEEASPRRSVSRNCLSDPQRYAEQPTSDGFEEHRAAGGSDRERCKRLDCRARPGLEWRCSSDQVKALLDSSSRATHALGGNAEVRD